MSDLKLVAPDQPTPLERLLLDAATNESPSVEQRMRVRAALGLAAMTAPPPPVARVGRLASLGKVAIGGAVAASAIIALMLSGVLRQPASSPGVTLSVAPAPAAPPSVASHLPAPVETGAEPVASPLPPIEAPTEPSAGNPTSSRNSAKTTAKGISSVSKSPAPVDSASDLGEQLRLIDAARAAIAAGNASAASQALSSYSAKFPHGSFGQEAAVLRIETVDLQGNHAQAASLAQNFLAQHPNSPHVSLVQRVANRAH